MPRGLLRYWEQENALDTARLISDTTVDDRQRNRFHT
jgi:hypothetical protein